MATNMTLEGLVISLIEKFGDDGNKDEMKAELRDWMTSRLAVDCFDISEINRRYPELALYLYGVEWIKELDGFGPSPIQDVSGFVALQEEYTKLIARIFGVPKKYFSE